MSERPLATATPTSPARASSTPAGRRPAWAGPWPAWSLGLLVAFHLVLRLAFASVEPTGDRFWDERYGLENLGALLGHGRLEPANGYHPSLSYLPQAAVLGAVEALHRVTGDDRLRLLVRSAEGEQSAAAAGSATRARRARRVQFTPLAYQLCRATQALFGAASLVVVYLVGARLFTPAAGLLAAAFLAAMPWHVRQSAIYKPDILLVLVLALAFLLALRALERPTARRFALAGAGIGLALATKFNAAPIALPLCVGVAVEAWRGRRLPWHLALAAATSIAVFLTLNPFLVLEPGLYVQDFSITLADYEEKGAERAGGSSLVALWRGVEALSSFNFFGAVLGTLAFGGLLVLGTGVWPRDAAASRRLGRVMAASYVFGYAVAYALATSNPSPHNWLPVTPFLAVLAAGLVVECYDAVASRGAGSAAASWRRATAPALLVVVVLVTLRPSRFVYETLVPTTSDRAAHLLLGRLSGDLPRLVALEAGVAPLRFDTRERVPLPAVRVVDAAEGELAAELDQLADAEVARTVARRAAGAASDTATVEPAWFRTRGPALSLSTHRWSPVPPAAALVWDVDGEGRIVGALPPPPSGATHVSLELLLRVEDPPEVGAATIGSARLPWLRAGRAARRYRWLTPRLPIAALGAVADEGERGRVRLDIGPALLEGADRLELFVYGWAPPAGTSGASASGSPSSAAGEVATPSR